MFAANAFHPIPQPTLPYPGPPHLKNPEAELDDILRSMGSASHGSLPHKGSCCVSVCLSSFFITGSTIPWFLVFHLTWFGFLWLWVLDFPFFGFCRFHMVLSVDNHFLLLPGVNLKIVYFSLLLCQN